MHADLMYATIIQSNIFSNKYIEIHRTCVTVRFIHSTVMIECLAADMNDIRMFLSIYTEDCSPLSSRCIEAITVIATSRRHSRHFRRSISRELLLSLKLNSNVSKVNAHLFILETRHMLFFAFLTFVFPATSSLGRPLCIKPFELNNPCRLQLSDSEIFFFPLRFTPLPFLFVRSFSNPERS